MSSVLGNILCDLDSCKCIFYLTIGCSNMKLCWCIGHMKSGVLGNILCDLGSRSNNVFSW